jgi:hypothetical protein
MCPPSCWSSRIGRFGGKKGGNQRAALAVVSSDPARKASGTNGERVGRITRERCSNTGFYIVYNDRRDRTVTTPQETLGRSLVIKYTKRLDF